MRLANLAAVCLAAALLAPAGIVSASDPAVTYSSAAQILLERGQAALEAEKHYDALTFFESALVADPGSLDAMVAIGRAHEALGQRATGLAYYRRALVVDPNHMDALKSESLALLAEGELDKAQSNRERLQRICGEEGCDALAEVSRAIADYKAEKASVAAAKAKPDPDSGGS